MNAPQPAEPPRSGPSARRIAVNALCWVVFAATTLASWLFVLIALNMFTWSGPGSGSGGSGIWGESDDVPLTARNLLLAALFYLGYPLSLAALGVTAWRSRHWLGIGLGMLVAVGFAIGAVVFGVQNVEPEPLSEGFLGRGHSSPGWFRTGMTIALALPAVMILGILARNIRRR